MCQGVSDILTLMFLLKLCGMLVMEDGKKIELPSLVTILVKKKKINKNRQNYALPLRCHGPV